MTTGAERCVRVGGREGFEGLTWRGRVTDHSLHANQRHVTNALEDDRHPRLEFCVIATGHIIGDACGWLIEA